MTGAQEKTVDDYLLDYEGTKAELMRGIRRTVLDAAPHLEERIAWGMPSYKLSGYGYIIQFAAAKNHIGLFPGPAAVAAFEEELKGEYAMSKGTIRLQLDKPLPGGLIRRIVAYNLGLAAEE
jgi:uncharacterized protein YdhG (YjbR/CyaY superfamily)